MKIDKIITQRFIELENKAISIVMPTDEYDGVEVNYSKFYGWATSVFSLLERVFGEDSIHYKTFAEYYECFNGSYHYYSMCKEIFLAAKEDYESGYLNTIRGLIKAEDASEILDEAAELLNNRYKDPACVLSGVALELALKELCQRNSIPIAKLDAMNIELCKKNVYNLGMQKQITAWSHWRNKAAHGEWGEYNDADVSDMIKGVGRFVADYL